MQKKQNTQLFSIANETIRWEFFLFVLFLILWFYCCISLIFFKGGLGLPGSVLGTGSMKNWLRDFSWLWK